MDGKAHALASVALAPICAGAAFAWTHDPGAGVGAGLGCLAGIWLTPDLDQEGLSAAEWSLVKKTGGLGFLWMFFWHPYAICHRHRGVSHWPIIGTAGRLLYITVYISIVILALALLGVKLPIIRTVAPGTWWFLAWTVAGLTMSDTAHWIMDW